MALFNFFSTNFNTNVLQNLVHRLLKLNTFNWWRYVHYLHTFPTAILAIFPVLSFTRSCLFYQYIFFFRYYNILSSSEKFSKDLLKWFDDNLMKSNPNKWRLLVSSCEKIKMEIGDLEIESSTCEKPTKEAILTIYQSYAKRSVKT